MYLASYLERAGHQADIIDLELEGMDLDSLAEKIKQSKADLIGITASTPIFHVVRMCAQGLRERLKLPIVLGGPHITVTQMDTFTDEFDFGVVQEGEETLKELMDELSGDKNFARINGLIYRENGEIKINPARPYIKDLDSLPFPAREKVQILRYNFEVPGRGVIPVGTFELTRGCPFKCVFCSEPLNTGKLLRRRDPAKVVDEILEVKQKFGIDHFFALDSTLTAHRALIEGFCRELMARKANVTFEGQTRANLVDESLLQLLKDAGLRRMNFGVESGNREVLKLMKKEVPPEAMRKAFALCEKLNISATCGLMMGNPGDTRKTILESAWFIRSIPQIRFAPLAIAIPYPGTELMEMAKRGMYGLKLLETDYSKYSRYAGGVMEVDGMKPKELLALQTLALIIVHSTPSKAWGLIQHFGVTNIIRALITRSYHLIALLFGYAPETGVAAQNTTLANQGGCET
jgi:anaerobic magnesium-protoporphyrin IX monomethyl ester cyclase